MSTYGLSDRFEFGKYEGALVSTVIRRNPWYVDWCLSEIEDFALDPEADAELEWQLEQQTRNQT